MIYLNGKIVSPEEAKIEPNDRGFLLSDGLFETMRVYNGQVFCLKEHWERLKKSADYLEIALPISIDDLQKIIIKVLDKNKLSGKDASLRLTITRGTGPRGLLFPIEQKPTVMLAAFPFLAHISKPATTYITSIRRNEFSPLSKIKSLSYLDNILARREATKNGADEGILLNTKGNVAETSAANIFIVTNDNNIITPPLTEGVLPGITRHVVIELCKELNISIAEKPITPDKLYMAKEIFLTNSLIEIQSVTQANQKIINDGNVGSITIKLQEKYKEKIKKNFDHFNQKPSTGFLNLFKSTDIHNVCQAEDKKNEQLNIAELENSWNGLTKK